MSKKQKIINYIPRFLLGVLLIALSLKQIQERFNLIKLGQDNISKSKKFLQQININDLNKIYAFVPAFINMMNYFLLLSGVLLIIQIMDNLLFMNSAIFIQLLLVNNIFLDNSSKCYLMASAYVGIYGVYLHLRN